MALFVLHQQSNIDNNTDPYHIIKTEDNPTLDYVHVSNFKHQPLDESLVKISGLGITTKSFDLIEDKELLLEPEMFLEIETSSGFDDGSDITAYVSAVSTSSPSVTFFSDDGYTSDFFVALGSRSQILGSTEESLFGANDSLSNICLWLYSHNSTTNTFDATLLRPGYFDHESETVATYYVSISGVDMGSTLLPMSAKNTLSIMRNNQEIISYIEDNNVSDPHIELDPILACGINTVDISGGSGYEVGETFTVGTTDNCVVPAIYSVTSVNEVGSITDFDITFSGENFFESVDISHVTYNGASGQDANIDVNDSFIVLGVNINNYGKFYSVKDSLYYRNDDGYIAVLPSWSYTFTVPYMRIDFQDTKFQVKSVAVTNPGYAHIDEPIVKVSNSDIKASDYIISNKNNFDQFDNIVTNNINTSNRSVNFLTLNNE